MKEDNYRDNSSCQDNFVKLQIRLDDVIYFNKILIKSKAVKLGDIIILSRRHDKAKNIDLER